MNGKIKEQAAWSLSLSESMQIKGIALLFLLLHHLFYVQKGLYDDVVVHGHPLVQEAAFVGKVCVALFVLLSGYGLGVQYRNKEMRIGAFYKRRFTKLYKNYWLMWLLFVPAGILFFGRTLDVVYEDHVWQRLLINLAGLQFYSFYGFNATWWFMSCIIGLYFLFPFYILLEKVFKPLPLLLLAFFLWVNIPHTGTIRPYILPFAIGICMARDNLTFIKIGGGKKILLLLLLLATIVWRQYGLFARGITIDPILSVEIVLLYKSLNVHRWISTALEFIGKHSMNIFLFHTFIYYYYFQDFIYCTRNPLVIYLLLLSVCLVVSMGIEWLKGAPLLRRVFK